MLLRTGPRLFVAALAACLLAAITFALPVPQDTGTWQLLGSLTAVRSGAAAALLDDGTALVAGGRDSSGALSTVEALDAAGGSTALPDLGAARADHTATMLKDGRVLVAGGSAASGTALASAEIYTPGGGWSTVAMHEARAHHTATRLDDGRVLIAGGDQQGTPVSSIEIFDPAADTFSVFGAALTTARTRHTASMLPTNRVLIAGGFDGTNALASTEIVNVADGVVAAGPSLTMPRLNFTSTRLLNGDVLFAGGTDGTNDLASADLYAVSTGDIAATTALGGPRQGHLALLLPNNNGVLVIGGTAASQPLQQSELYLPDSRFFQATGGTLVGHLGAVGSGTTTDGTALVAGGDGTAAIEGYRFATVKTDRDDYAPGSVVTITGSGWVPGETVALHLEEQPDFDSHPDMTALVQADGTFVNTDFSPDEHDLNIRFTLTARGSQSEAQNTFTDQANLKSIDVTGVQTPAAVAPGSSATFGTSAATSTKISFNGSGSCTVGLSVISGLLAGSSATFAPATVTGNNNDQFSLLTVNVSATTAPGTYTLTVQARGTGGAGNDCVSTDVKTNTASLVVGAGSVSTNTTLTASVNPSVVTQIVTFTANVAAASGTTAPTGSVQFVIDGTDSGAPTTLAACAPPVAAHACATLSTSALTAGAHTVSANYTHTGSFTDSSGSLSGDQQVNLRTTSTTIAVTPTSVVIGQASTATITVTDTQAAGTASHPAGVVTVSSDIGTDVFAPVTKQCTLAAAAPANQSSCTVDIIPADAGTHHISASFAASTSPAVHADSSTGSPASLTVTKRPTTTAVSLSPSSVVVNQASTVNVTVTDTGASGAKQHPAGSVTVATSDPSDTASGPSCTLAPTATDGESKCSITVTPTAINSGSRTITATFADTAIHTGSSDHQTLTVTRRSTTTAVVLNPTSVLIGQDSLATVTVTDTAAGTKSNPGVGTTVSVTSDSGDTIAGTCTLVALSADSAKCQVTITPASIGSGTHKISATFALTAQHDTSNGSANLTVTKRPTSTAVVLTPASVVVNEASTVDVTVTDTGTGTKQHPSGTVTVGSSDGTDTVTAPCTLAATATAGESTCSVTVTPAAFNTSTRTITATFADTAVHTGSSDHQTLTVARRTTSTAVVLSPTSVLIGEDSTATITVTDTAAGTKSSPGVGTTVTVTSDSGDTIAGTCTLVVLSADSAKCQVTVTPTSLGSGTHKISAAFAATTQHEASNGSADLTVTKRPTTTAVGLTPSSVVVNQASSVDITVTDTGAGTKQHPAGNVTIASSDPSDALSASSCALAPTATDGESKCAVTVTPTAFHGGSRTITATFSETAIHLGGTDHQTLTVTRRTTSTAVVLNPTSVIIGQNSSATVTVTDTAAAPKSNPGVGTVVTVTSDSGDTIAGTCTLVAQSTDAATCQVTITPTSLGSGTHKISAAFAATEQHEASGSSADLTVTKRPTSTSVSLTPSSVVVNEASTVNVTVMDTGVDTKQHPAGTITIGSSEPSDNVAGTCTLAPTATDGESKCVVSVTPTTIGSGSRTITATFAETAIHLGSSDHQTLTVTRRTTSTSVVLAPASVVVAQGSLATVTITDTSAGGMKSSPGVGTTVTLASDSGDNFSGACTLTILSADQSQCQVTVTPNGFGSGSGTHKITATFAQTGVHDGGDGSANLTVARRSTSTAVTLTPASVVTGQTSTVSVSITDSEAAGAKRFPTGTVAVTSSDALDVITSTCSLSNSGTDGVSTCSVSVKPAHVDGGSHVITATFAQTDVHSGSTNTAPLTVGPAATQTTITTDLSSHTVTGQSYNVAFTVTVQAPGSGTPTGNVTVSDGSQMCSAMIAVGHCTLISTTAGTKSVVAVYAGDGDFLTSTSLGVTHVVDKAATTTAIVADTPDPSLLGQLFTVSWMVTVNAPGSGVPTGSVTVDDGTGAMCTAPLAAGSCTLASTTVGAKTLTATYSGDANFLGGAGTAAHQVNFGFAGLFDPYGPPPRSYKINSAIPLKWQYTDNSGTPVATPSAAPQVLIVGLGACGDATGDPIVVDDAGKSGYQYDPTLKMWQFNWKTTGLTAGCYGITIKNGQTGQLNPPPGSFFVVQLKK
jgi:hypothetical protein